MAHLHIFNHIKQVCIKEHYGVSNKESKKHKKRFIDILSIISHSPNLDKWFQKYTKVSLTVFMVLH